MRLLNKEEKLFCEILKDPYKIENLNLTDEFLNFLKKTKLSCLLYSLSLKNRLNIPQSLKESIRTDYIINFSKQLIQLKEIVYLANVFKENNIDVIFLKGPLLSKEIYDDEGARRCGCDIDFIIKRKDYSKLDKILKKESYTRHKESFFKKIKFTDQVFLYISSNKTPLDLHIKIFSGVMLSDLFSQLKDESFKRYSFFTISETKINVLSKEMLFIYLCILFCKEEYRRLRFQYLIDLYFFLKKYKEKLDEQYLLEKIDKNRLNVYIFFSLDFLKYYFSFDFSDFFKKIDVNKIRKIFIYWAIPKYWQNENNRFRFKKYSFYALVFSKGYFFYLLRQLFFIFKVSYEYFYIEIDAENNFKTFLKHLLFFLKRTFSKKPRVFTLKKLRDNENFPLK